MDSCLDLLNWLSQNWTRERRNVLAGFIRTGGCDKQMQYGCRMNQNHQHRHRKENTWRITQTVIELPPSFTNGIPVWLATNSSSLSSSSCSPLLSTEDKSVRKTSYRRDSTKLAIRQCTGITMNDLTA